MRIGVFGGTFDPPHLGHLAVAQAAADHLELHEVILVPAHRNPLKTRRPTASKHRLEMTRRLASVEPFLTVSDLEISRGGPSYAIDTVQELKIVKPGDYWFIVGADALATLTKWKQPERLLKLCRIAAVVRPPHLPNEVLIRLPQDLRSSIDIVPMSAMDISSTDLRDRVSAGQSVNPWIPEPVVSYIRDNKLYRS